MKKWIRGLLYKAKYLTIEDWLFYSIGIFITVPGKILEVFVDKTGLHDQDPIVFFVFLMLLPLSLILIPVSIAALVLAVAVIGAVGFIRLITLPFWSKK